MTQKDQQRVDGDELLAAARALHQPSVLAAGEYDDGTCAYCSPDMRDDPLPLVGRFQDYLNGSRRKVWMHAHPDQWPVCSCCASGYDGRENFPCQTAVALGWKDGSYPVSGVSA